MSAKKIEAIVAVIMGSDSDLPTMAPCMDTLASLAIPHRVIIASAHRTPEHLKREMGAFERGGGKVIIAAAGGAAHLPGVIASLTLLPVIGVPIASPLLGIDSLLSIVQMPAGIPVATVGIGAAKNAALLAAHILALSDVGLKSKLTAFRKKQSDAVIAKSKKLRQND
jgi:5-(carboxyamino)imidazole ribonucleotide mutase